MTKDIFYIGNLSVYAFLALGIFVDYFRRNTLYLKFSVGAVLQRVAQPDKLHSKPVPVNGRRQSQISGNFRCLQGLVPAFFAIPSHIGNDKMSVQMRIAVTRTGMLRGK